MTKYPAADSIRKPVPILFLSDSPDCPSGLARIGRDLAARVQTHMGNVFRVGYLGRGGVGGDFPYPVWTIPHNLYGMRNTAEWGSSIIHEVWKEFTGSVDEPGIIFTIWDPGRMLWLSQPKYLQNSPAHEFLTARSFKLWGYFPVDGHTPSGGLGLMASEALKGYDRVLGYTPYGSKVLGRALCRAMTEIPHERTIYDDAYIPWIPHGLDEVWSPRDKKASREYFKFPEDSFVVGVVATNQRRKDWGLAGAVCQILRKRFGSKFRAWFHIDQPEKDWNIMAVCSEFGLEDCTMVTLPPQTDEWLAAAYSACDVTLAIGAEGFGFPIVESQACGVPVVHGDYAGGACFVPTSNLVVPFHDDSCDRKPLCLDGLSNIQRMVYDPQDWVDIVTGLYRKMQVGDMAPLRWPAVWPKWEQWFRGGLE